MMDWDKNKKYHDFPTHIADLNAALKRRDETIIKQADEIAELRAELKEIHAEEDLKAALFLWLCDHVGVVDASNKNNWIRLEQDNAELRAELARIKPSWDDAPGWATSHACRVYWRGQYNSRTETFQNETIFSDIQARPKDE